MINNARKGFTLIEILIVVAIIAILASVVLVGLGPTQQSGRDARRLSDLHEVQNALELYYNKCGFYPGDSAAAGCPNVWTDQSYAGMSAVLIASNIGVSQIPTDPSSNRTYYYSGFSNGSSYTLGAGLENANNSVFSSYTPPANAPVGMTGGCAAPNYCISL